MSFEIAERIVATLRACPLFAGLPGIELDHLAASCTVVELRGGERLLRTGQPSTHLYVLAVGRLRALRATGERLGEIAPLEPVGEMGLITGEPHGNEVEALRDSVLLRISREAWQAFVDRHPSALLALTRTILRRLRPEAPAAATAAPLPHRQQCLALVAAHAGVPLEASAGPLLAALAALGGPLQRIDANRVDAAIGAGTAQGPFDGSVASLRLAGWLAEQEAAGPLLYVAGGGGEAWTERCLRQADRILVVAESAQAPEPTAALRQLRELRLPTPVQLVLLRAAEAPAGAVAGWCAGAGAQAHVFVDPAAAQGWASLARQLLGCAPGVVLGGGGARGFAHIGLFQALEALQLPVDLLGGTSMGAFFAALRASGADSRAMREIARDTFVRHNYLNDYVLPRVSLLRGRRFLTQLRSVFGSARMESLWRPCFCVSTNLSRGVAVVHDHGELAMAVGTSMAVPGVVPPIVVDGELLVDGAIVNSLPTDVMRALGRGPVIASDVSTEGALFLPGVVGPDPEALLRKSLEPARPRLVDILFRSATLTSESGVKARAARADCYLRMPVTGIGLFDWARMDEVIERGYRHAMEQLPAALERLAPPVTD